MLVLTGLASSGDVLLSINGIDLTQLTYNEAVSVMKAQTAQSQVVLRVIQTLSEDTEEDNEAASMDEVNPGDDFQDDALNWTPLWTRWLGLPRYNLLHWLQNPVEFNVRHNLTLLPLQSPPLVQGHRLAEDQQRELGLQHRGGLRGEPGPAAFLHQNHCSRHACALRRAPEVRCNPLPHHVFT